MVTLGDYLIVSGILFAIGFAGVMLRRNLIIIFMSLELMLNAANLSLVAFSRFRVGPTGLTRNRENATSDRFAAFNISSSDMRMIMRLRRSITPANPIAKRMPLTMR